MPLLCCLWRYSSIFFFLGFIFTYVYESPLVLGKSCFGWRAQFFCMGPALYSKTVRYCGIWNIPHLRSWELVIDFMTQVLFMADYTWAWTVAICVHRAMNGAGEESLTQSLFLKEERALRAVRHLLRRQCWNECQQCHFNNPLKSLKSIQCEFIAKLKIQGMESLLHACIFNSFTLL